MSDDLVRPQNVHERLRRCIRRRFVRDPAQAQSGRIIAEKIYVHSPRAEHGRQHVGVFDRIIHAFQQAVLNRHRATTTRLKPIRGSQNFLDRKTPAHRKQLCARRVIRRMQ